MKRDTAVERHILFGLHAAPPKWLGRVLSVLPFAIVIAFYLAASHVRLSENPSDKILPSPVQMVDAVERMAFAPDNRTGRYLMVDDTLSSLRRLALGVCLAGLVGLLVGMNMGIFPGMSHTLLAVITFVSIVPPLAILPILFVCFGVDELSKIMLIFLGTFPLITRDVYNATRALPLEQITKALTLGASQLQVVYRIVLPQIVPRLIDTMRLSLGGAWLFLIAAEAIASTDGLGYRIFLVRRYLAMDIIIPYVIWITFIGFTTDWALKRLVSRLYPWYR